MSTKRFCDVCGKPITNRSYTHLEISCEDKVDDMISTCDMSEKTIYDICRSCIVNVEGTAGVLELIVKNKQKEE